MASPHEGHFKAVYHMYGHLKGHHNARMVFDPTYPNIDRSNFLENDWKSFYEDVEQSILLDAPKARGKEVDIHVFTDLDLAADKLTRC